MSIPVTSAIDIAPDGAFAATKEVLTAKYTDAGNWAEYAATILEGKLTSINTKADDFNIAEFIAAAKDAITGIEQLSVGTITYTAPDAPSYVAARPYSAPDTPTYETLRAYAAPSVPTYDTLQPYAAPSAPSYQELQPYNGPATPGYAAVPEYAAPANVTYQNLPDYVAPAHPTLTPVPAYAAPTAPEYAPIVYTAPAMDALHEMPSPQQFAAGTAPETTVAFENETFSDPLLDSIRSAIATGGTGLGAAEEALFARETARQNTARLLAYNEITTQFSARGFEMPPGALLAKQTEINNESNIRLADSSSQIMAESAKLAQAWNQTTLTAAAQMTDILARVMDSKIMRNFEAAKNTVLMGVETFKAKIQEVVANAQLEGIYLGAVGTFNDVVIKKYTGEIGGETAKVGALAQTNQAKASVFSAAIQGAMAPITAGAEMVKAEATVFSTEVQAALAPVQAAAEINKALASSYMAEVQAATAPISAVAEVNRALASAHAAEIQGAVAEVTAPIELNRSLASSYAAEIQGAVAQVNAPVETNRAKAQEYAAKVQGAVADVTAPIEINRAKAQAYAAEVQGATADAMAPTEYNRAVAQQYATAVQGAAAETAAMAEKERARAQAHEIASRKALGVADIASKFSLSQIDAAVRKYLGDIQVLQSCAQSAAQMVASALNGVQVTTQMGASTSSSGSIVNNTTVQYDANVPNATLPNPTLPYLG